MKRSISLSFICIILSAFILINDVYQIISTGISANATNTTNTAIEAFENCKEDLIVSAENNIMDLSLNPQPKLMHYEYQPEVIPLQVNTIDTVSTNDNQEKKEKKEEKKEKNILPVEENADFTIEKFTITGYCPCSKCCGKYAKNRPVDEFGKPIVGTASGNRAIPNKTIGVDKNRLPFGTKVEIDGIIYEAQDTGSAVKGNMIDIYCDNHDDACKIGKQVKLVKIFK